MSIFKLQTKANPSAAAANMQYICRDSACDDLSFFNLPELENDDLVLAKSAAEDYAEVRQIEEDLQKRNHKNGQSRNHHRATFSFDRKVSSDEARHEVHEFLQKEMPDAKAVIAVHQDTDHTHAHAWIDSRGTDGKKLHFNAKQYRSFDEKWATQYDQKYQTNYAEQYKTKKEQTKNWKKERAQAGKIKGKQPMPESKPARYSDQKTVLNQKKEERLYGVQQERIGGNQRIVAKNQPGIEEGKRIISQGNQQSFREKQAIDRGVSQTRQLHQRVEKLPERKIQDRDLDRKR